MDFLIALYLKLRNSKTEEPLSGQKKRNLLGTALNQGATVFLAIVLEE